VKRSDACITRGDLVEVAPYHVNPERHGVLEGCGQHI
jgi:hypothetical protein